MKIDGSENPAIPPFGGRIDYLTYAGIYRDAWLKVTGAVSIRNIKIETANVLSGAKSVTVRCDLANPQNAAFLGTVTASLKDGSGTVIATATADTTGEDVRLSFENLTDISLWDISSPTLYEVVVELKTSHGSDRLSSHFGFRTAEFTPDGFLLNGKPLKLRGLNRHQSFPYVGYAAGPLGAGARRRYHEVGAEVQYRPHLALPAVEMVPRSVRSHRPAGLRRNPRLAAHRRSANGRRNRSRTSAA